MVVCLYRIAQTTGINCKNWRNQKEIESELYFHLSDITTYPLVQNSTQQRTGQSKKAIMFMCYEKI